MSRVNAALLAFNRGPIDPLALARTDFSRTALSAEVQTNYMPRVLGSMMARPGSEYLTSSHNDAKAYYIPFVYANDDTALIELTDMVLRPLVNEAAITRPSVSTTIANGSFSSSASWTDADEAGGVSTVGSGQMTLLGDSSNSAIRTQTVAVAGGDIGVEHGLRIVVSRGPVRVRIGSSSGGDEYVTDKLLSAGTHSFSIVPSGNIYLWFANSYKWSSIISSVQIEGAGVLTLPTPWGLSNIPLVRYDQSADVIFSVCHNIQPRKVKRYGVRSWGIELYEPSNGPFRVSNTGAVAITPSATTGDITLTASQSLFRTSHVGALWRLTSQTGQHASGNFSGDNVFTSSILVTGTGTDRILYVIVLGTFTARVTLQKSIDNSTWDDAKTWTAPVTESYNDSLDNQEIYYRIGINTGEYTSGVASMEIGYAHGDKTGIARITAFTSPTSVSAKVLVPLGASEPTTDWEEGLWSDYRGWPSVAAIYESRFCLGGGDKIACSISDAYEDFDDTMEGDSGPIVRSIGSGPVAKINWMSALQRLVLGADGAEHVVSSSSLDEPLSPTAFNIRAPSTYGSSSVIPVKIDNSVVFVHRSGMRLLVMKYDSIYSQYSVEDLSVLCHSTLEDRGGIVRLAVQRVPDTRIHCVMADGTVVIFVFDPLEEVKAAAPYQTDGTVIDAIVLPGATEDKVYYSVRRSINGVTKYMLERWAKEGECIGGTLSKQADCHYVYNGAATTTISGLGHLEGKSVIAWGNGKHLGTFTVSGGSISGLSEAVSSAVIGLNYTAVYKSTKLAYAAQAGTALTQKKKINHLGLILRNTHYQGIQYGQDFTHMNNLPLVEKGVTTPANTVWSEYDEEAFSFGGSWDTDCRLCLQASAKYPVTILAAVIGVETNERV